MASEQFSLCWDNFHKNMSSGMNSLLENEDLVDVTLAVEGKYLKAHKMVLSVCSPYFKELFKTNPCQHPIVFMKDVSYVAISDLLQFMYQGEVQVSQENLTTFIKTAEALQIKGLTGDGNGSTDADVEPVPEKPTTHRAAPEEYKPAARAKRQPAAPVTTPTPTVKRARLSASSSDSQPLPPALTKSEPISSTPSTSEPVQFKMEPYDNSQSIDLADEGDDNFGDDTLDDNTVDDNEDYSMMEGEGEPQAGTSADGAGEGQEYKRLSCKARGIIPVNGNLDNFVLKSSHNHPSYPEVSDRETFVNQIKVDIRINPKRSLRDIYKDVCEIYLVCAEHKRSGCRGRATIPVGASIGFLRMTRSHNHPPDMFAEEKDAFVKELKKAIRLPSMKFSTLRKVYEAVAEMYLRCATGRESNCKASYVVAVDQCDNLEKSYKCVVAHNHAPNQLALQTDRFLKDLEQAVKVMPGTTRSIFDLVVEQFPLVKEVYTYNNLIGRMQHWLRKYNIRKRDQKLLYEES